MKIGEEQLILGMLWLYRLTCAQSSFENVKVYTENNEAENLETEL